MSDYAGYAAAVTIHTQVFDDQFLSAYGGGQISHWVRGSFGQAPGAAGSVNLFFQPPKVICSDDNEIQAILRLSGWGTISVRLTTPGAWQTQSIEWQADVLITPTVSLLASLVLLTADSSAYRLVAWQFDVLSGTAFSADAEAFLNGDTFKAELETLLRNALGDIKVPIIDFSSLGPFSASSFSNVTLKVVGTGMLLGVDMDTGTFATTGDFAQLSDIAGTNDVAVILNPGAILPLMPKTRQQVQDQITPYGATLSSLSVTCEEGQFRVTGSASRTGGSANFSLAAVPVMSTGVAGGIFPLTEKKTIVIRARNWPALSFNPADISVDVDQSWWVDVLDVFASILTLGFAAFADQAFIWGTERNITGGIEGAELNPNGATPLVARVGEPPTRFGIQDFEIHTSGVYIGISSKFEAPAAKMSGVKSIPVNYASQDILYSVTLPFDALADDPFLRIRWTVVDLDSGSTLESSDDVALNRQTFEFIPSTVGAGTTRFAVGCRVYRALGPFLTEVLNETIRMTVGAALPHNAYIRWSYEVNNPQFQFKNTDNTVAKWHFTGMSEIPRHSKIHRLDKPCRNANHRSRFISAEQFWETLPFPVAKINANRESLCDYCFFGGPGSTIASL